MWIQIDRRRRERGRFKRVAQGERLVDGVDGVDVVELEVLAAQDPSARDVMVGGGSRSDASGEIEVFCRIDVGAGRRVRR